MRVAKGLTWMSLDLGRLLSQLANPEGNLQQGGHGPDRGTMAALLLTSCPEKGLAPVGIPP